MIPDVATAIDELREAFVDATVTVREDGDGGAFVTMQSFALGAAWAQPDTWIGFHISFQYPVADVYPHFVRPDLARADGSGLGEAMSLGSFEGAPAVQISRASRNLNPAVDTAALKLTKVLAWLVDR